ncbi:hypothetical protein ACFL3S_07050 [Gemmatimonadota bacterium]
MKLRLLFLFLMVTGCGLPPSPEYTIYPHEQSLSLLTSGGRLSQRMLVEDWAERRMVLAPVEQVWQEMPSALSFLGIPVRSIDDSTGVIWTGPFEPENLGGKRLSLYLDCGSSHGAVHYADSYRVTMAIVVRVRAEPTGGTRVENVIEAVARSKGGTGDAMSCSSLGRLLTRMTEVVEFQLGIGDRS